MATNSLSRRRLCRAPADSKRANPGGGVRLRIGKAARADDAHPSRCAELCHFPADAARADNACGLVPEHNGIVSLMLEPMASLVPVAPMKPAREVEESGQDILGHRALVGEPA